jgi:predicted phosphodiesterase
VLIAVNPVWGFSWYFNSENWATAAWQKIAESRVDDWRAAMTAAAVRVRGAAGVTAPGVFEVAPAGIRDGDFSFVVIGDPGEGDPSQHALRNQVLRSARREEVKFIVIASDVIYPNGEMRDYETNFYLPMMGIDKPILAIPGNHDWFNALDGFAANLMPADTARAAIEARVQEDLNLSSTTDDRVDRLIEAAGRLRSLYRLPVGLQHAPFFEIHAGGFSLIAIDTGIKRQVDARQLEWIKAALARSAGAFTMAIVGHPFYAAGRSQIGDDGSFKELHDLLRAHGVRVMMAGDTHDFEYYREAGTHYFVNGGGGAYLSIGTALDWPERAALADYAFYPRTDAVSAKLDNETPPWKWPAWWWIRRNGAWPFSVEALSAVFDFNRAPFFQSFVEVRVERSAKRVVFAIIGVDGPLRWRDLQTGGAMMPAGQTGDDLAEIVVAIDQP